MSDDNNTSLYLAGFIIAITFILLAILNRGWQSVIFYILGILLIIIILTNRFIKTKSIFIKIFQATTYFLLIMVGTYIIYENIFDALITAIGICLILSFFYFILKLPRIEYFQKISSKRWTIIYIVISLLIIIIGIFFSMKFSIIYLSTVFFGFSLFFISLGILNIKEKSLWTLIGELMFTPMFLILSLATENIFLKISCILVAFFLFIIVFYRMYRFFKS